MVWFVGMCACGADGAASSDPIAGSTTSLEATTSGDASDASDASGDVDPGEPPPPLPDVQRCRFGGWAPGLLPNVAFTPVVHTGRDTWTAFALDADATVAWLGDASGGVTRLDLATGEMEAWIPARLDSAVSGLAVHDDLLAVRWQGTGASPAVTVERFVYDAAAATLSPGLRVVRVPLAMGRAGAGLAFDTEGMLLVPLGDMQSDSEEGASGDVAARPGNLLRFNVHAQTVDYEPVLPRDNPWFEEGGVAAEAWAHGLRDPAGCSVDGGSGALWCVDRGGEGSEASQVTAGANLGWPSVDGDTCRVASGDCFQLDVVGPALVYPGGCGAVQGAVGRAEPLLDGAFIFGDRCSGEVWAHRPAGDVPAVTRRVAVWETPPLAFASDTQGALWGLDADGTLGRIHAAPTDDVFPTSLRDSGCFEGSGAFAVEDGVIPFEVNAPLWTDGAIKRRAFAMPAGQTLGVGENGRLEFPRDAVVLKHFLFEREDASVVPVETRVMVRRDFGWEFHSYRWDADGADATLLSDGARTSLPGGPQHVAGLPYSYPSRNECRYCHGTDDADVIGLRVDQLARDVDYGSGPIAQLDALAAIGVLPQVESVQPIARIDVDEASVEARARAYLHANCGHCHRPSGWAPPEIEMNLDATTPLAETGLCAPVRYFVPWFDAEERLVPGDPDASLVWLRASDRGDGQMPPLGTFAHDPGAAVLSEWIASMDDCE